METGDNDFLARTVLKLQNDCAALDETITIVFLRT